MSWKTYRTLEASRLLAGVRRMENELRAQGLSDARIRMAVQTFKSLGQHAPVYADAGVTFDTGWYQAGARKPKAIRVTT